MGSGAPSFLPELVSGRGTARRSRVVEGQAGADFGDDAAQNRVGVPQDFYRRDAQGCDAGLKQPGVALRPVAPVMRFTVYFDRQAGVAAKEIEAVRPGGMLPTEFYTSLLFAKDPPEDHLRQRHFTPKATRVANSAFSSLRCDVPEQGAGPSTMLRMVPLPETSSGRILTRGPLHHAASRRGLPPRSGEELR